MKKVYLSLSRLAVIAALGFFTTQCETTTATTATTANGNTPGNQSANNQSAAGMSAADIAKEIAKKDSELQKAIFAVLPSANGMTEAQIKAELAKPATEKSDLREAVKAIVTANTPAALFTAAQATELNKLSTTAVANRLATEDSLVEAAGMPYFTYVKDGAGKVHKISSIRMGTDNGIGNAAAHLAYFQAINPILKKDTVHRIGNIIFKVESDFVVADTNSAADCLANGGVVGSLYNKLAYLHNGAWNLKIGSDGAVLGNNAADGRFIAAGGNGDNFVSIPGFKQNLATLNVA